MLLAKVLRAAVARTYHQMSGSRVCASCVRRFHISESLKILQWVEKKKKNHEKYLKIRPLQTHKNIEVTQNIGPNITGIY